MTERRPRLFWGREIDYIFDLAAVAGAGVDGHVWLADLVMMQLIQVEQEIISRRERKSIILICLYLQIVTRIPLLPLALPMSLVDRSRSNSGGDYTGNLGPCISDVTFTSRCSMLTP